MQRGVSGEGGFDARHISPDKHARAQALGYEDGVDLIKDVAKNHDVVVEQVNGRLILVTRDKQNRYVVLEPRREGFFQHVFGKDDPFYGVTTGFPDRAKHAGKPTAELPRTLKKPGNSLIWKSEP